MQTSNAQGSKQPGSLPTRTWRVGSQAKMIGLGGLVLALMALAFAAGYRVRPDSEASGLVIADERDASRAGTLPDGNTQEQEKIVVHVTGAVKKPGLYELPPGSRLQAALDAAGGFSENADVLAVNPALKLADADQIIVPEKSEAATVPVSQGLRQQTSASQPPAKRGSGGGKLRSPGDGSVNVNTASAEELQRLPGVGPAIARRIVEYRSQIGRFTSVEQLLEVSGIGEKKLAAMAPFLRLR